MVGVGSGLGVSVGVGVCVAVAVNVDVTVKVGVRVNLRGGWVVIFSAAPDADCVPSATVFTSCSAVSTIGVSVSPSEVHAAINANAPLSAIASVKRTPRRAQEPYLRKYSILKD